MKMGKRLLSLTLAAALTVGLCGCGKLGGNGGIGNLVGKKSEQRVETSPEYAKQGVFRLQELNFSAALQNGKNLNVLGTQKVGDKIYIALRGYHEAANGSIENDYGITVLNLDGSVAKSYSLQSPKEDTADADTADAEGADQEKQVAAGSDQYEYEYYNNFQIQPDGYVFANRSFEVSYYSEEDGYNYSRTESICCWDLTGALLWSAPLDALTADDSKWFNINSLIGQKDGSVKVIVSGDEQGMITVSKDGEAGEMQPLKGLESVSQQLNGISMKADGTLLVSYYDESYMHIYVADYNPATDQLGAGTELPASMSMDFYGSFTVDENNTIYYSNDKGVYKYHIGDEAQKEYMNFVNSDLYLDRLDTIVPLNDEQFIGLYTEYDEQYNASMRGGIFTYVKPEDVQEKKVLLLGGNYVYGDIKKRVVDYNKTNGEYRIVIKDYSQYNTYDDYNASTTQMNNDIIAGNMPDILIVNNYNMSVENYAVKGLLADIGKLIEEDEQLKNAPFMENVFEAYKIDGKLYEIIPSFYVNTYAGKKSIVGDRTHWTMADAQKTLASFPVGTNLFSDMTQNGFISIMMEMRGADFVDVSTGKCSFDSDEFIALLEYAKTLPAELNEEDYGDNWYRNYESQYREDRTLLNRCYIGQVSNLVSTINGSFGEDVSFVGFPNAGGCGGVISADDSYALSARSANLDAAWQFMKYYLTDEYQSTIEWSLPINRTYLEQNAQKATKKPTYIYDGKEEEDEYYYWINDEDIILEPLTQKQVDDIVAMIGETNRKSFYNTSVTNIIEEEVGAFFKNQKSAKDVAAIIQSRAQLYVNENR
ncbi:MAG: extracellular solute-binding protein [Lachnospiraceae bacterium]|nr:extracellular solute-binding protein [Lachnospiraceae bacterium]